MGFAVLTSLTKNIFKKSNITINFETNTNLSYSLHCLRSEIKFMLESSNFLRLFWRDLGKLCSYAFVCCLFFLCLLHEMRHHKKNLNNFTSWYRVLAVADVKGRANEKQRKLLCTRPPHLCQSGGGKGGETHNEILAMHAAASFNVRPQSSN